MKVIGRASNDPPRRRVIHVDLSDRPDEDVASLRSDLRHDLRSIDRSMAAVAEDLAEATLHGIRRYRRERAEANSEDRPLRRIPLHAARATVVAIEATEGSGDEIERVIDESALRRRLRRALRR